jgi:hypothetical protein
MIRMCANLLFRNWDGRVRLQHTIDHGHRCQGALPERPELLHQHRRHRSLGDFSHFPYWASVVMISYVAENTTRLFSSR